MNQTILESLLTPFRRVTYDFIPHSFDDETKKRDINLYKFIYC